MLRPSDFRGGEHLQGNTETGFSRSRARHRNLKFNGGKKCGTGDSVSDLRINPGSVSSAFVILAKLM